MVPRCEERSVVAPGVGDSSAKGLFELMREPMRQLLRSRQHFKFAIAIVERDEPPFGLGLTCALGDVLNSLRYCVAARSGGDAFNQEASLAFLL